MGCCCCCSGDPSTSPKRRRRPFAPAWWASSCHRHRSRSARRSGAISRCPVSSLRSLGAATNKERSRKWFRPGAARTRSPEVRKEAIPQLLLPVHTHTPQTRHQLLLSTSDNSNMLQSRSSLADDTHTCTKPGFTATPAIQALHRRSTGSPEDSSRWRCCTFSQLLQMPACVPACTLPRVLLQVWKCTF